VLEELEVLRIVGERLEAARVQFMLTGSFALAYYAKPRMTRDLDFVIAMSERDMNEVVASLSPGFYVDADSVRSAVRSQRMFNLMHLHTSIKVDLIIRKDSEYRHIEFSRRRPVELQGIRTWIVSREDLILSKLVWAKESESELQRRDVRALLDETVDSDYLNHWAARLDVARTLAEIVR
jgi:hypothetical protein